MRDGATSDPSPGLKALPAPTPEGPRADPGQQPRGVAAERPDVVSPLLDQQGGEPQAADPVADLVQALAGDAPGAGRVGLGDVEADRDDQRLGLEPADDRQRLVEGLEVAAVEDVLGKWQVDVEALAFPLADLVGEPREIRVGEAGVAVDRDGQDVGPVEEDVLGAVAVMVVDVQDGDPPDLLDRGIGRRSRRCRSSRSRRRCRARRGGPGGGRGCRPAGCSTAGPRRPTAPR